MRKLLLVTVATLGVTAGMSDVGFAQDADGSDAGQAAGAPGTITVRLNGRFRSYTGWVADQDANAMLFQDSTTGKAYEPVRYTGTGNVAGFGILNAEGKASAPPTTATLQLNKNSSFTTSEYVRLYPGFDGVAANGLKYGASIEIRQDNNAGAGGGVYGSPSTANRERGDLYVRREWGYLGTDQLGTLRFGGADGPSTLFMTGNFENFNDGGWNGDVNNFPAGVTQPVWPFADVGSLYTLNRLVYLSPQLYGADFSVAYAPGTGNSGLQNSACNGNAVQPNIVSGQSVAGAGCDRLASTSTGDYTRPDDIAEAFLRYRNTFGDFGLAAYAGYIGSSKVNDAGNTAVTAAQAAAGFPQRALQYNGFNLGAGGAQVTYAGFTVGGMAQGGAFNGQWNLQPQGAVPGIAWLAGASYTYGPVIVGVQYFDYFSAGSSGPTSSGFSPLVGQRRERGLAAGGTYSVAPGLALFLSYLYGERKENGYDFLTGQTSTVAAPVNGALHNVVQSQVFTLGTSLTW